MSTQLARVDAGVIAEKVLIGGDLAKLTSAERVDYYARVCESVGLNPLTKPFDYITLNGKLTLYAKRDCTDQLRKRDGVSVKIVSRESIDGVFIVVAQATTGERSDESIGAVNIEGLKGDARANAMMKAETKAKRRVTLSICGLGLLDESEIDSIPGARPVDDHHSPGQPALTQSETPKVDPKPEPPQTKPPSFAAQLQAVQAEIGALPKEELGDTSETLEKAYQAKMPGARGERAGQLQRAVREAWLRAWISFLDPNEFADFRSTIRESGLKAERIETLLLDLNTAESMLTETVA